MLLKNLLLLLLAVAAGCADSRPPDPAEQPPAAAAPFRTAPWSFENHPGHVLTSAHYQIFTTFNDDEVDRSVVQVMEAALKQYQRVAPGVPLTDKPMQCFLFGTRTEWTDFTRRHTGPQANVYLQINRGGYTVRDWYVAYFVGEAATYSVAAHEGWHQFVYRHFKGRLPPFLEEGIATIFEDVNWHNNLPYWKLAVNRSRTASLRRAIDGHELFPLPELMQMHAGNVVRQPSPRIEAFYAQDWAFATFLWDGDGGSHRAALRQLMSDTADGTVFDPTGSHQDVRRPWLRQAVAPMIEHYLAMNMDQIEAAYAKFIEQAADSEMQWN